MPQIYLISGTKAVQQFINNLRSSLQQALPGRDAQYRMAPSRRERVGEAAPAEGQFRPSAVMILFCVDDDSSLYIPLIERMPYHGVHSAQISLPGGKFDRTDVNLERTALRECFEEIGIQDIEVLGELTQLHISVSGFLVQPFIGVCKTTNPSMILAEREVKSTVKLKLEDLLNDSNVETGTLEVKDRYKIDTPWFNVGGHKVWGATAMILSELKELIRTIS
ncbi:MAG: CoA pyrophosphatase [bacterium]|nr:CoA pyrophosphatase [bacterium]